MFKRANLEIYEIDLEDIIMASEGNYVPSGEDEWEDPFA